MSVFLFVILEFFILCVYDLEIMVNKNKTSEDEVDYEVQNQAVGEVKMLLWFI